MIKKKKFALFTVFVILLLLLSNANVIAKGDALISSSAISISQAVASFGQEASTFSTLFENRPQP